MTGIMRFKSVTILCVLLFAGCLFFGSNITKTDQKPTNIKNRETLYVLCPKLSGSADCFLLKQEDQAILIDAGLKEDGDTILSMLKANGVESLEALILTHYDKDHIGGAAAILNNVPVERCYMACGSEDSQEYAALQEAIETSKVEAITLTDVSTFRNLNGKIVIYPARSYSYSKDTDNNISMITKVSFDGKNLLFMGDAQKERTDEFLEKQYDDTAYDFLKVQHHGKSSKAVEALLQKISPSYAVITSSDDEKEDSEVPQMLEKAGISVWYTKKGDILFEVTKDQITVEQN